MLLVPWGAEDASLVGLRSAPGTGREGFLLPPHLESVVGDLRT